MIRSSDLARRRLLAPEVIQTSAMDCGPAALTCLLEGFGIKADYARLQEACHLDLDGTSINTIEQIALTLGLDAEQVMLPIDYVLLKSSAALPALVVVRREYMTHFLIVWRRHGPLVQVMDPAKGRRWLRADALQQELYLHRQRVPADAWMRWARSQESLASLSERLNGLKLSEAVRTRLVRVAREARDWRRVALLDAAIRMVGELVLARGLRSGPDAGHVVETIVTRSADASDLHGLVPASYWSVLPDTARADGDHIVLTGAVLLRVKGTRAPLAADSPPAADAPPAQDPNSSRLPPSITGALADLPQHPLMEMWRLIRSHGRHIPAILAGSLMLAAAGALLEIMLLRGALEMTNILSLREHRIVAIGSLLGFVAAMTVLDVAISSAVLQMGRRVEVQLRGILLEKLPRLGDSYFQRRLVSDMAHRAHTLEALRGVPDAGARFVRTSTQLLFTALALAWIDPPSAGLAVLAVTFALAIPLATGRILAERELRQRSHSAALGRHYLDSLLGLVAGRTHGAERALRHRHESLLVEWGRSSLHLLRGGVVTEGVQLLVSSLLAAWLVLGFIGRGTRPGSTLLFVYWALTLPLLARELAATMRQFPAYRNILARLLEPLRAAEDATPSAARPPSDERAVAIDMHGVEVQVGGRAILEEVDLSITSGEHVAIVGRSGAGKSSLLGVLLGWRVPTAGRVFVDRAPLDAARLVDLRCGTAWVDPAVHLWNRSLFDNLKYGDRGTLISSIGSIVDAAELGDVLERLPAGLQSVLGESGRLTSGGEGQRVRFGRALVRHPVRLALLDEPFRGLDRARRHELLMRARDTWREQTLLCVTHDIEETLSFERVLVLDEGRIVEDGPPATLAKMPDSLYAELLAAEQAVRTELWSDGRWRRWRLENGAAVESAPEREQGWSTDRQSSHGR